MAAFLGHGFSRLSLERLHSHRLSPFFPWLKRTERTYDCRACMSSGPFRYVPGSYTLGERDEDLDASTRCGNSYNSINERSLVDKGLDSSSIQVDGVLQYNSTMYTENTSSNKKPLYVSLNSERKIDPKCRSKLEMPVPSSPQIGGQCNVEDARHVLSFEMKRHGCNKNIQQRSSIVDHVVESNHNIPFSAEHLTQPSGLGLFDSIDHVPDGIADIGETSLIFTESNSMQMSEIFGIETNNLQGDPSSSRREVASQKTKVGVKNEAIQALAARPLTASELRKKLSRKNFPSDMIEAVIIELQASGIQSDSAYAEIFSRSRWLSMSWGPKRIKQALMQKGVSEKDADRALLHVFNDDNAIDKENRWGISESAKVHLLARATKQWLRGQNVSIETRKQRMIRWLQYRGFNWDVINAVLRELQSKYPT